MRKDNFLIAMINKGVINPGVVMGPRWMGCRRRATLLTKTLEWNLRWWVKRVRGGIRITSQSSLNMLISIMSLGLRPSTSITLTCPHLLAHTYLPRCVLDHMFDERTFRVKKEVLEDPSRLEKSENSDVYISVIALANIGS